MLVEGDAEAYLAVSMAYERRKEIICGRGIGGCGLDAGNVGGRGGNSV